MLNSAVPDEINIEITSRCNMDCIFCPLGVCTRKKQDLPDDSVHKVLDELVELKKQGGVYTSYHISLFRRTIT